MWTDLDLLDWFMLVFIRRGRDIAITCSLRRIARALAQVRAVPREQGDAERGRGGVPEGRRLALALPHRVGATQRIYISVALAYFCSIFLCIDTPTLVH